MPRVLVTGADGFVGKAVCARLSEAGHEVVRATRTGMGGSEAVGDIGPGTEWTRVLGGVETVVHLAAHVHAPGATARDRALFERVNVAGTARLARQSVEAGAGMLVFLSTVGVVGSALAAPVDGRTPPAPANLYASSKLEAERRLLQIERESDLEVVVLRAPLTYGPGAPGSLSRLRPFVERGVPLPLGAVKNRRSAIAVDNLASAVVATTACDRMSGLWYVEDGTVWSSRQMVEQIGNTIGRSPRLVSVPVSTLHAMLKLARRPAVASRLLGSLVVDGSAFQSATGWTPLLPVGTALSRGVV